MSGKPIDIEHHSARNQGAEEDDVKLLESMGLNRKGTSGGKEVFKQYNNQSVWKMLMGDDAEEGEGRIIWNDGGERDGVMGKQSQDGQSNGKPGANGVLA